ncbi:MAG: hypothetical protein V7K14_12260 [Nostoc sp.]|nr:hypothetical protein [Nostoc sp. NMS7]
MSSQRQVELPQHRTPPILFPSSLHRLRSLESNPYLGKKSGRG